MDIASWGAKAAATIGVMAGNIGNQLGGTFLAPGSTMSVFALLGTLALALVLGTRRGQARRGKEVRLKVALRALFPRRLLDASGRTDIAYFLFSLFCAGAVVGWSVLSAGLVQQAVIHGLDRIAGPHAMHASGLIARVGVTIGAFIVADFIYWLNHLLSHKWKFLWQFHAVHHSAHHLNLLTNFRIHPVDVIVFYNMTAIALGSFLGLTSWWFGQDVTAYGIGGNNILVMLSAVAITHLQHSHLWVTYGPRWGRWLLGPAHHQIHHSAAEEHFDTNLGNVFAIWDRLYGSFTMPTARRQPLRLGVDNLGYDPHSLQGAAFGPFVAAWRVVRGNRPEPAPVASTPATA